MAIKMWTFSLVIAVLGYGLLVNAGSGNAYVKSMENARRQATPDVSIMLDNMTRTSPSSMSTSKASDAAKPTMETMTHGMNNENITCPKDWVPLHRGCYLFEIGKKKWTDASKFCQEKQGALIVVQSAAEKNSIAKYIKANYPQTNKWYSGFEKKKDEWKTIDNEELSAIVVWKHQKMATKKNQYCGYLQYHESTIYLGSSKCRQRNAFICEYHTITTHPSIEPTTLLVTEEVATTPTTASTIPTTASTIPTTASTTPTAASTTPTTASTTPTTASTTPTTASTIPNTASTTPTSIPTGNPKDEFQTKSGSRVSRSTEDVDISLTTTEIPERSGETDSDEDDKLIGSPEDEEESKEEGTNAGSEETNVIVTGSAYTLSTLTSNPSTWTTKTTKRTSTAQSTPTTTPTSTAQTTPTTTPTSTAQSTPPPTPRPASYDWEEALEEFEGCYIPGGGRYPRAQVMKARRLYTKDSSHCPPVRTSNVNFPKTEIGEDVKVPCRKGSGFITFTCDGEPACWQGQPDVTDCASPRFRNLLRKIEIDDEDEDKNVTTLTAEESISVMSELVQVTEAEDVSVEDIIVTSKVMTAFTKKSRKVTAKRTKKQIAKIVDNVVKAGSNLMSKKKVAIWKKMTRENKVRSASSLMIAMETATVSMTDEIQEPTVIKQSDDNIEMEIQVVSTEDLEREKKKEIVYDSSQSDTSFSIPLATLKSASEGGLAKVVFMTHYSIADLLGSRQKGPVQINGQDGQTNEEKSEDGTSVLSQDSPQTKEEEEEEEKEEEEEEKGPELASYILSASLGSSEKLTKLLEPISFTMKHTVEMKDTDQVLCSFWNVSQGNGIGFWSQDGCKTAKTNATHTTCECDHMTNFAILLDVHNFEISEAHQSALRIVTIIGCIISAISLTAAWFTFQCFPSLQGERTTIHKNLAVCLLVVEILFVTGVDQAEHRVACSVIAVFLHFFFLAAFTWMFLEGLHIMIMLTQVFDASRSRLPYYYMVGYGVPFLVVGISCLVYFPGYGTDRFCWLTTERNFIWAFAGPVAVILLVNAIFLGYALTTVCRHADYVFNPKDKTTGSGIRQWILGALALEVLLGLTWMFGYFLLSDAGLIMAYIFTILNSIQGLFIFIFHCLLNKKAQKEYRRVMSIQLGRSSSSAGTQSTLTKRNNASRSHSLKQSFNRGTNQPQTCPTTPTSSTSNGNVIVCVD